MNSEIRKERARTEGGARTSGVRENSIHSKRKRRARILIPGAECGYHGIVCGCTDEFIASQSISTSAGLSEGKVKKKPDRLECGNGKLICTTGVGLGKSTQTRNGEQIEKNSMKGAN